MPVLWYVQKERVYQQRDEVMTHEGHIIIQNMKRPITYAFRKSPITYVCQNMKRSITYVCLVTQSYQYLSHMRDRR